jgi:hypothetical protein
MDKDKKNHPINKPIDRDEKAKRESEANDLQSLLSELSEDLAVIGAEANKIIPKKIKKALDYEAITKEVETESQEIVKQSILFFFEKHEIEAEPYIREKMKVDFITISNLMFQMKTSEHAIIRLLEQIDEGSSNIKQFEVLSKLQSSKMDIVKHLQTVMTVMETNYKNLRDYYKEKENDGRVEVSESKQLKEPEGTIRITSGKDLAKSLRHLAENSKEY